MNTVQLLEALNDVDDKYIVRSAYSTDRKHIRHQRYLIWIFIAAAVVLCGFTVYKLRTGGWIESPAKNPADSVRNVIENQIQQDYALRVELIDVHFDDKETARIVNMYMGSELAQARGWSDELFMNGEFIAVKVLYYTEYDHKKTFIEDGITEQYFYVIYDSEADGWIIAENTSPHILDQK